LRAQDDLSWEARVSMSRRTRLTAFFAAAAIMVGLGTHELVASNDIRLATTSSDPNPTSTPQASTDSSSPSRQLPTRPVHRTRGS
jgi:hypothetical protein